LTKYNRVKLVATIEGNMSTQLVAGQVATVKLSGLDVKGDVAPVYNLAGSVATADAAVLAVTVNADGTLSVTSLGPIGAATVTFTATDAAVNGNVLSTTLEFTVVAGPAVQLVATVVSVA